LSYYRALEGARGAYIYRSSRPRRSKTLSAGGRRGSANTLIPITASYRQIISRRELGIKARFITNSVTHLRRRRASELLYGCLTRVFCLSPSILIPALLPLGTKKRARQEIRRHLHCHQRRINITSRGIQPPHPLSQIIAPFFIHVPPQRELSNHK
jgi:hypothetical protein